jgi:hypothetical protein
MYKVPEVTMRSASSINSQNGEPSEMAPNILWFVGTESDTSYEAAVKVKLVSFCQIIFRNSETGFIKLWSPLTQIPFPILVHGTSSHIA